MLLRRLLAVWLLVALAVTGIGYYIEVNKFEEGLAAIAASEMRTLSAKVAPDGDKEQQVLAEETKDFIRKHHLWIRVYNHHGRLVRELYNPKYTNLTEALKATISPMPHDGRRHFARLQHHPEPLSRQGLPRKTAHGCPLPGTDQLEGD